MIENITDIDAKIEIKKNHFGTLEQFKVIQFNEHIHAKIIIIPIRHIYWINGSKYDVPIKLHKGIKIKHSRIIDTTKNLR